MTFQQEEELFPTIGADGIPAKDDNDTSVKVNVDALAEKDADNANEAGKANGKRKVPEKPAEKKVSSIICLLVCLTSLVSKTSLMVSHFWQFVFVRIII